MLLEMSVGNFDLYHLIMVMFAWMIPLYDPFSQLLLLYYIVKVTVVGKSGVQERGWMEKVWLIG